MEAGTILQMEQSLRNLGLSLHEVKVIAYLFRSRRATSKEISKNLAIPFNMVQLSTSNLTRRGLLRVGTDQEKAFIICSTKDFKLWIQSEKNKHAQIYDQAEEDLDGFFQHIEKNSWQPQVLYYEGEEDIKQLYHDMLEETEQHENKEIYSWQDIEKITKLLSPEYVQKHIQIRTKKNIKSHAILPDNKINQKHKDKSEGRSMKLAKGLNINGDIRIFDDSVSIVTFDDKKPIGFVFKGELVTSLFRNIFKSFWNNLD